MVLSNKTPYLEMNVMSFYLSLATRNEDDPREALSETEQELELIAILFIGMFGLLIARPIGAMVEFARKFRDKGQR